MLPSAFPFDLLAGNAAPRSAARCSCCRRLLPSCVAQQTGSRAKLRTRLAAIASGSRDAAGASRHDPSPHGKQIKTKLPRNRPCRALARGNRTVELRLRIERAGLQPPRSVRSTPPARSCALIGTAVYFLLGFLAAGTAVGPLHHGRRLAAGLLSVAQSQAPAVEASQSISPTRSTSWCAASAPACRSANASTSSRAKAPSPWPPNSPC